MAPRTVAIVLDRARTYAAQGSLDRTDVRAVLGLETPQDIGFRSIIHIDDLLPGGHELRAYALAADDAWYEAAYQPFWAYASARPELGVGAARARLSIDSVLGMSLHGTRGALEGIVPFGELAVISGWAFDPTGNAAPAGVCAIDDRGGCWSAPCDVRRPDVPAPSGASNDRLGFELRVPSDELGRGQREISVYAFDATGRRFGRGEQVVIQVAAEIRSFPGFARRTADDVTTAGLIVGRGRPVVFQPSRVVECKQGDVLPIEGWAVAGDGEEVGEPAQIFLELRPPDVLIPPLRYHPVSGFRRRLPTREIPEPPREDAWFSYLLDTSDLAPRTYALRVAIVASNRCSYACGELGNVRVVPTSAVPTS